MILAVSQTLPLLMVAFIGYVWSSYSRFQRLSERRAEKPFSGVSRISRVFRLVALPFIFRVYGKFMCLRLLYRDIGRNGELLVAV